MRRTAIAMLTVGCLGCGLGVLSSCAEDAVLEPTISKNTADNNSGHTPPAKLSAPSMHDTPSDLPGLEHAFRVNPHVISGGVPTGDAGFETLAQLGVRTVISVDAAPPEVEALRARGIRSIHIPVEYAGISSSQRQALAVALRDADGPIYIHCHHGKHRGPTAAALGLLSAGMISPERARELQQIAGTSTNYPGLFACVKQAQPYPLATFATMEAELPEIAEVGSMASAMARIDRQFARLQLVAENDWNVPATHPDLAPVALAASIEHDLRSLAQLPAAGLETPLPNDDAALQFIRAMTDAATHAAELEAALARVDARSSEQWWRRLSATCTACHTEFRNETLHNSPAGP